MDRQSVVNIRDSLATGSKRTLSYYCGSLRRDYDKDDFDDKMLRLMKKYAFRPEKVEVVRQQCNSVGYSQSRKKYEQLIPQLERFCNDDYTSFRWNRNYQEAKAKLKKFFSKASLRELCYSCDNDIVDALPKKTTHSGWTYVLTGHKPKGENLEDIFKRFKEAREQAIINGTFNLPILCGIRTQCSNIYDEEGNLILNNDGTIATPTHKTRLVSMVDLMMIVTELKWAKPVQKFMSNHVGWYAGGKSDKDIWMKVTNDSGLYEHWICLDYSKYDQSISSWLIYDAFEIIRAAFIGEIDDALWNVMVNDFVHKCFIDGEGKIWESHRGVPSGSMWTQIIDSVVNMLMITTFAISKNINKFSCQIMGDDNLVFINDVSKDELCSYLTKNFGIVTNIEKSCSGKTRMDYPEFLSRIWGLNGPYRHSNILMSKLMFPERRRSYNGFTPEVVFFAYCIAYPPGMKEAFDVERFTRENPISREFLLNKGMEHLPGLLGYSYSYGLLK